jgi:hypothetical protein
MMMLDFLWTFATVGLALLQKCIRRGKMRFPSAFRWVQWGGVAFSVLLLAPTWSEQRFDILGNCWKGCNVGLRGNGRCA